LATRKSISPAEESSSDELFEMSAEKWTFFIFENITRMMTRQQKKALVKEVVETIQQSKSLVFVDFRGMGVTDTQAVKKTLREAGVKYKVLKKKLFDLAAKESGLDVKTKDLEGQLAVAFSLEDEVVAAKILNDFGKGREDVKLVGGVLEGRQLSQDEAIALAKIPSKQELLARLVGSMNAPVSGLAQVLSGNARGLVVALKAIADQKA